MKKKYIYLILFILLISLLFNFKQYLDNDILKSDLGQNFNRTFFYCNFKLNNLKITMSKMNFDKDALNRYSSSVLELEYMMRDLPFDSIEVILRSIERNLNNAIEKQSRANDYTHEFKEIYELIEIINDAYEDILEICGDDYVLWYNKFIDRNNQFVVNLNKSISQKYDELVKE